MKAVSFFLLPDDLQLCILQTWIGSLDDDIGLLRILSTLDKACVSKKIRPAFLFLASQPSFIWTATGNTHGDNKDATIIKNLLGYLSWVQARQVPVRSLCLSWLNLLTLDKAPRLSFKLPSVQGIILDDIGEAIHLQAVLDACPNLTSIEDTLYKICTKTWNILLSFAGMKMKRLICSNLSLDVLRMCRTVSIGGNIEELRLGRVSIAWQTCVTLPRLQALEICVSDISTRVIIQLLASCGMLKELILHHFEGTAADVELILQAGRAQLKRFGITRWGDASITYGLFAEMVAHHGWLEYVQLGACCSYHRPSGYLKLFLTSDLDLDTLGCIFTACVGMTKLDMDIFSGPLAEAMPASIGQWLCCSTLTDLTIQTCSDNTELSEAQLISLPLSCPMLVRLKIISTALTGVGLRRIAMACRHLQVLAWEQECGSFDINDYAIEALFTFCPDLKELSIDRAPLVSYWGLHAILEHKHHLAKLTWKTSGFEQESIDKFKQEAKQRQLLPVPEFVKAFAASFE